MLVEERPVYTENLKTGSSHGEVRNIENEVFVEGGGVPGESLWSAV
jgi:hypothetical protein